MMRARSRWVGGMLGVCVWLTATAASAQIIGTFRWQFAPHCNVVTLTVSQVGSVFRLEGNDDQCGAAVHAAANGTAHLNPNGSVSMGITIIRPDGVAVQTSAIINFPALTGTWTDDFGNSGTFAFNAPSPSPGPPWRLTLRGDYSIVVEVGSSGETAISFGRSLPTAPQAVFLRLGNPPTASCPGTPATPEAAPGFFCVYEASSSNVFGGGICHGSAKCDGFADRWGAMFFVSVANPGRMYSGGTWAVTP